MVVVKCPGTELQGTLKATISPLNYAQKQISSQGKWRRSFPGKSNCLDPITAGTNCQEVCQPGERSSVEIRLLGRIQALILI